MLAYTLRRLLDALPTVFLSSVLIFLLLRLLPGDPALVLAGGQATPETVEQIRQSMGFNEPLPVQYVIWLSHVACGDLGTSIFTHVPSTESGNSLSAVAWAAAAPLSDVSATRLETQRP